MNPRRLPSRGAVRSRRRSHEVFLEFLETRIALSTFNVATESDLRNAIALAESNGSSINTINLTASVTLGDTTAGEL